MRGNTHIPESTITNMMTATALRDLTFIDLTPVSKEL